MKLNCVSFHLTGFPDQVSDSSDELDIVAEGDSDSEDEFQDDVISEHEVESEKSETEGNEVISEASEGLCQFGFLIRSISFLICFL
jgi:hypothetical protein